jgi:hypothetical protein
MTDLQNQFLLNVADTTPDPVVKEAFQLLHAAQSTLNCVEIVHGLHQLSLGLPGHELDVPDEPFNADDPDFKGYDLRSIALFKCGHEADQRERALNHYYKQHVVAADTENALFATIDSCVSEPLRRARATWHLAVAYEDNEKNAIKEGIINNPFKVRDFESYKTNYCDGFRMVAAETLKEAAELLMQNGHNDFALSILEYVQNLSYDSSMAGQMAPNHFAEHRIQSEYASVAAVNNVLDPCHVRDIPYTGVNENFIHTMRLRGQQSQLPRQILPLSNNELRL